MDWAAHAETWPNAERSRFLHVRPHRWHVQEFGAPDAPVVLLLHGAGGATHSWRDIAPALAQPYRVIAPDLPGQGFTRLGALQRSSLELMADDSAALLRKIGVAPAAIVGHSAGGALALRLAQILPQRPAALVGVNAALENFEGAAGILFPMMAKALAMNPFAARAMARLAQAGTVERLISGTGSRLDPTGLALYRACIADSAHIDGTLTMMAQWRLSRLWSDLRRIEAPTLLLAGAEDRAVPPATAERAAARLPHGRAEILPGLGHLAHEEAPAEVGARIAAFLAAHIPGGQANAVTT